MRYLVAVGGYQTGLVKKHARWILTLDPEAGLEMFTEMQPPLSPDSVLPILASHAPSLCATYLEAAIAQGSVSAQVGVPLPGSTLLPVLLLRDLVQTSLAVMLCSCMLSYQEVLSLSAVSQHRSDTTYCGASRLH